MTTTDKPVTRESTLEIQGRRVLVQLEGKMIRLRQKGLRSQGWMPLPLEQVFYLAARANAELTRGRK